MSDKYLHIVAFDIPYPPNYGGVIDVYYKLKALHKKGIRVILHCFEYPGRERSDNLNDLCEKVYYYPRLLGLRSALSLKPYIVASRRSEQLVKNLLQDDHPILFEGLHSCYYIDDKRLKGRILVYRESNIEHRYYFSLAKADKNLFKRIYFLTASIKLRLYQKVLKHASLMLVVSEKDTQYLQDHFPIKKVVYLPSFHANDSITSVPGKGHFALYNGNIEVPENAHAVKYLMGKVFKDIDIPLIIAGMNPPGHICKIASQIPNISVIANPGDEEMFELIKNAHVNILVTSQATGLKLKLLNTLYRGRYCLVNDKMLNGTGLDEICEIANDPDSQKKSLKSLFQKEFKKEKIVEREKILSHRYSNERNINQLISLIFQPD